MQGAVISSVVVTQSTELLFFRSASKQRKLPRKTTSRKLVAKVKDFAKHVMNSRIASRVQTDPTTPLNEEQIEYVAATIHSAIEFAAALDLDRWPRLSRTSADKRWRRRRVKILPPTVSENGKVRVYQPPRMRSRRHPAKVMYLRVEACPQLQKGFDGKVCLQSVSRTKILERASRNTRYSVDVDILQAIKSGEWIQLLVTEGMTAEALLEEIKTHYDLDEYVSDRLVIGYYTYTRQGVKVWKELHPIDIVNELGIRTNEDGVQVVIQLQDLEVFVQQEAGDKVEEDTSCDSDFMLRKIPEIGAGLRSAYQW
ncbi:hypothetical protein IV203_033793 [Nitzschia inconspicua]|uniref:Uncharacterized protein n=1 Tax=Nitzschia inconspicua TaxID=303405 RepID=A0A9K3M2V9_9STRA|nr:hypothetical protein IV203_033793 [Nitzschia inconspicua]